MQIKRKIVTLGSGPLFLALRGFRRVAVAVRRVNRLVGLALIGGLVTQPKKEEN